MTWFKVDDSFHSHPKVLAAQPAALGLWVVAGAWCSANLTDGFVPDYAIPRLLPDAGPLAEQLVTAGLWKRTKGGYRFHDWSDYNPRAEAVKEERAAARDRMRTLRAKRRTTAKKTADNPTLETDIGPVDNSEPAGQPPDCSGEQAANVRDLFVTPTRPDPTRTSYGSNEERGTANAEPPRKRGTRLPPGFAVTDDMKTWFAANCPGVDGRYEHAKFVDHFTGASGQKGVKADWVATWRNWMRRAQADLATHRGARGGPSTGANRFHNDQTPEQRARRNPFAGGKNAIIASQHTGETA